MTLHLKIDATLKRWKCIDPPQPIEGAFYVGFVENTWGAYVTLAGTPVVTPVVDGYSNPDELLRQVAGLIRHQPRFLQGLLERAQQGQRKASFLCEYAPS